MVCKEESTKKATMRVAMDVIQRFLWDEQCDADACIVGYHDRLINGIVEKKLSAFSNWGHIEQAGHDALAVPQHRITYFKLGDRIIWDKRCRLDLVFGSTPPFERIDLSSGRAPTQKSVPDEALTPLQELLKTREISDLADVRALLTGPGFRCKVTTAKIGSVAAYGVMYDDPTQFAPQPARDVAHRALDHCRGCVYEQGTNRLLCRAFDKFWEIEDRRATDVHFEDADLVCVEKADGLLTKVFYVDGKWRCASNGCIDAFQAVFRWGDDEASSDGATTSVSVGDLFYEAATATCGGFDKLCDELHTDRCYAFELAHPRARVVVPHEGRSRLVHIGTWALPSGREILDEELRAVPGPRRLPPVTTSPGATTKSRLLHFIRGLPAYCEGIVVRDSLGKRVKIKGRAYLAAHGNRDRTTQRGFFELSEVLEDSKTPWTTRGVALPDLARVRALLPGLLDEVARAHCIDDATIAAGDINSQLRLDLERALATKLLDDNAGIVADNNAVDTEQAAMTAGPSKVEDRSRPNMFLAIKIDAPHVVRAVRALQDALVLFEPQLEAALLPVAALHITVATLRIDSRSERKRLQAVLADVAPMLLARYLFVGSEPVPITLQGVDSFRARGQVVFVEPQEQGRLAQLCNGMYDGLERAGFDTPGRRAQNRPHATVAKMSRALSRSLGFFDEAAWRSQGFGPHSHFGEQTVRSIELCVAGSLDDNDKERFYTTVASYATYSRLTRPLTTSDAVGEALLDQPSWRMLVILRGVPGAGKTTVCGQLRAAAERADVSTVVCSADFHMTTSDKKYAFDPAKLDEAHAKCRAQVVRGLQSRAMVIVDNTNASRREVEAYVRLAREYGARVALVELACGSLRRARELAGRGVHNAPAESAWRRWECLPAYDDDDDVREFVVSDEDAVDVLDGVDAIAQRIGYVGVILTEASRQRLLREVAPVHATVRAHHATMAFRPSPGDVELRAVAKSLGGNVRLRVGRGVANARAQAVPVVVDAAASYPPKGWRGHITISHAGEGRPGDARALALDYADSSFVIDGKVGIQLRDSGEILTSAGQVCFEASPARRVKRSNKVPPKAPLLVEPEFRNEAKWRDAETLYTWDFDDTLLETAPCRCATARHLPSPDDPASLAPHRPCRSLPALALLQSLARSGTKAVHVLLTGRKKACAMAVRRLLARYGALDLFDGLCFKPDGYRGPTGQYKARALERIANKLRPREIVAYDDDVDARSAMSATAALLGIENLVFRAVDPCDIESRPPLEHWLSCFGRGERSAEETRTGKSAVRLVEECWSQIVPAGRCRVTGSWPRGRRSDVDILCLGSSDVEDLDRLQVELLQHRGAVVETYMGRSPRRAVLSVLTATGVNLDVSLASSDDAITEEYNLFFVCALDAVDIALRARGIGGAPWAHATRTHELSRSLSDFLRDRPSLRTPAAAVSAYVRAVADAEIAPAGKCGGEQTKRVDRVRDAHRVVAELLDAKPDSWAHDTSILDALARAAEFPPVGTVALVRIADPPGSSLQALQTRKARMASATARLFQPGRHVILHPAPPEVATPGMLSVAVIGDMSPDHIRSLLREPTATVVRP